MKAKIEGTVTKPGSMIGSAAKSKTGKTIGGYLFLAGFLIALIAGIVAGLNAAGIMSMDVQMTPMLMGVLALIGLIVGIVNISDKEAVNFLIAAIAISATSGSMTALANLGVGFNAIAAFVVVLMGMIGAFVAPAAVIVGLKVIYNTSKGA